MSVVLSSLIKIWRRLMVELGESVGGKRRFPTTKNSPHALSLRHKRGGETNLFRGQGLTIAVRLLE